MFSLSTHLKTTLGVSALIWTVGCEASALPSDERSLVDVSAQAQVDDEVLSFAELNGSNPALVEELMSLQPIIGRDRTYRFSQPIWAKASSMPVLLRRLEDSQEPSYVRAALARALRTNRGPWHADAIEMFRGEADAVVRARLMEAFTGAPLPSLTASVVLGLADTDPQVRDWATLGATKLLANHPEVAVPDAIRTQLMTSLTDSEATVRSGAARALSFRVELGAVEQIATLFHDSSPDVRLAAVEAVSRLDPEGARDRVLAAGLQEDEDPIVSRAALRL